MEFDIIKISPFALGVLCTIPSCPKEGTKTFDPGGYFFANSSAVSTRFVFSGVCALTITGRLYLIS
jgi:hypothetical protein